LLGNAGSAILLEKSMENIIFNFVMYFPSIVIHLALLIVEASITNSIQMVCLAKITQVIHLRGARHFGNSQVLVETLLISGTSDTEPDR